MQRTGGLRRCRASQWRRLESKEKVVSEDKDLMRKRGRRRVFKAKHEREVPRRLGARAEAIEVPDWLTSAVRNSTGGGSCQSRSHDIWEEGFLRSKQGGAGGGEQGCRSLCAALTTLSQHKCTITQFLRN